MSKNNIIIALVVFCLVGTIWGAVQNKKSSNLERQLVAMRNEGPAASSTDEAAATEAKAVANSALEEIANNSLAELEELKSQNTKLLEQLATLKGNAASQKDEVVSLKKETAASDGSQSIEVLQAQLENQSSVITKLEEAVVAAKAELKEAAVAAKAELDQKNMELAAAAEATAGFEELKSTLANNVDAYSAKSQKLAADVEENNLRMASLNKALEERTKLLVGAGEELARTKLNMNVLLSRIGAQNNSLEILEETRIALEKELAMKVMMIEDLQQQLSGQIIEDIVVVGEVEGEAPAAIEAVVVDEEAPQAEEAVVEAEEVPAK